MNEATFELSFTQVVSQIYQEDPARTWQQTFGRIGVSIYSKPICFHAKPDRLRDAKKDI